MRLLFLLHPGTNSRSNFTDMIEGARAAGHDCLMWELIPIWSLYQRAPQAQAALMDDASSLLATFISNNKVDLTIAMWANGAISFSNPIEGGRSVTLFERMQHPHLMLWLDAPERSHQGSIIDRLKAKFFDSPYLYHWINNKSTAEEMREVFGFSRVIPHRYGINPAIFQPDPAIKKDFEIVFSGGGGDASKPTSIMLEEIEKDEPDMLRIRRGLAEDMRPGLEALATSIETTRPVVAKEFFRRLLNSQVEHRNVSVLHRIRQIASQDAGMNYIAEKILGEPKAYALTAAGVRQMEDFGRAFTISYLCRHFKCAVFGKVDYSAFGCRAESLGFIGYEEQARVYARGKFGLSVMRWQDEEGIHIKPYEICASGAACLAEMRPGLEEIFELDREIIVFETPAEACKKVQHVLGNPEKLAAITKAGFERTMRDHTWRVCMTEILAEVQKMSSSRG
ncbi:MAG TPA: glycosyltransferase [Tepidisphaeraceae bacterium]